VYSEQDVAEFEDTRHTLESAKRRTQTLELELKKCDGKARTAETTLETTLAATVDKLDNAFSHMAEEMGFCGTARLSRDGSQQGAAGEGVAGFGLDILVKVGKNPFHLYRKCTFSLVRRSRGYPLSLGPARAVGWRAQPGHGRLRGRPAKPVGGHFPLCRRDQPR